MKHKTKVWDLPVRLFHWTLAVSVVFMWYSAKTGGTLLQWHLRCGILILFLLVFRLLWGIWGSDTARFGKFITGISGIRQHLKRGTPENIQPGHNPIGALMVAALLAAVLFQVCTGLFAADENTFSSSGYLNHLVSEHTGSLLRKIHVQFFNLLAALAALHIAAIAAYRVFKKKNLVLPMITGYKHIEGTPPLLFFGGLTRLAATLATAAALIGILSLTF